AGESLGRERRSVHQRGAGHRDDAAEETRRPPGDPHGARRGVPDLNTEEEHDVVAAASAEVPPTPPGDTGTWRRLSRPLNQPANPGTANGRAETKHSRSFRITDNISLRMRLTLIYGMLFFAAGSLLVLLNYVILVSVLDKPDFTVQIDGYNLESEIADEIKAVLIDGIANQVTRYSVLALIVVGVLAVGLGYAVAGRALSPLHKITRTARRLSERSLHERIAMSGPDDEIRELADTFDLMLERLDRSFDGQRRFVANASHELRTPLAINRSLVELAITRPGASAEVRQLGEALLAVNERHERLIDGLLTLADSENQVTDHSPIDLAEVAGHVTDQTTAGTGLAVHRELHPAPTAGDPLLLERLVQNLVENAV